MVCSLDGGGMGMSGGSHGYPCCVEGWGQTNFSSFTASTVYSLTYLLHLCTGCAITGSYRCAVLGTHTHTHTHSLRC